MNTFSYIIIKIIIIAVYCHNSQSVAKTITGRPDTAENLDSTWGIEILHYNFHLNIPI